jgi:hypothetical protein
LLYTNKELCSLPTHQGQTDSHNWKRERERERERERASEDNISDVKEMKLLM